MAPPHFCLLNTKIGGLARYMKDKEAICLMNDQARQIYKAVKSENIFNIDTVKEEIEADKLDNNYLDGDKINPYYKY